MSNSANQESGKVKVVIKKQRWYLGGIASAMAAACTHPLDLLKVKYVARANILSRETPSLDDQYFHFPCLFCVGYVCEVLNNNPDFTLTIS